MLLAHPLGMRPLRMQLHPLDPARERYRQPTAQYPQHGHQITGDRGLLAQLVGDDRCQQHHAPPENVALCECRPPQPRLETLSCKYLNAQVAKSYGQTNEKHQHQIDPEIIEELLQETHNREDQETTSH